MRCDSFRDRLTDYLEESLNDDERRAVREHLAMCAECARWAVDVEPTLIFARATAASDVSPARVDACTRAVLSQVRQRRLERRLGARRRPWLAAAAAAVLALGAAAIWGVTGLRPGPEPAAPAPGFVGAAVREVPPPKVEADMAGEGVRVYQFAQEDDADTAVLYIVNPALES
jgi:anti-sigma factor RsiW